MIHINKQRRKENVTSVEIEILNRRQTVNLIYSLLLTGMAVCIFTVDQIGKRVKFSIDPCGQKFLVSSEPLFMLSVLNMCLIIFILWKFYLQYMPNPQVYFTHKKMSCGFVLSFLKIVDTLLMQRCDKKISFFIFVATVIWRVYFKCGVILHFTNCTHPPLGIIT